MRKGSEEKLKFSKMFSKLTLLLVIGCFSFGESGLIKDVFGAVGNVVKSEVNLVKSVFNNDTVLDAAKNVIDAKVAVVGTVVNGTKKVVTGVINGIKNGDLSNTGTDNTKASNGSNCTATQETITLNNKVQQFLSDGQQKIGGRAARYGSFALFWNSTKEQALIDLIHGFAEFKDQADSVTTELQTNLDQVENKAKTATGEEKAKLECSKAILKADLDAVKSANDQVLNDTRIQKPFEDVQQELKHVFDDFSTTDCPTFDNKMTTLLAKMKSISNEGKFYGLKRSDELKVKIEAEKQKDSDDLTQLSDLQNQYKDRVLHVLSFLALEKTNVENAITKANDLLKTAEETKKSCLISSIDKLEELSSYFQGQIDEIYPRLLDL